LTELGSEYKELDYTQFIITRNDFINIQIYDIIGGTKSIGKPVVEFLKIKIMLLKNFSPTIVPESGFKSRNSHLSIKEYFL
jgi:hypothetical protein